RSRRGEGRARKNSEPSQRTRLRARRGGGRCRRGCRRVIRYGLICDNGHDFEGWFASASDFDGQQQRGLVECPACGSHAVSKRLMAPSVSTARKKDSRQQLVMHAAKQEMIGKLKEMVTQIRANADDVGE